MQTEEQAVRAMFWAYLGRPADAAAVKYYAEMLRAGADPQQVERAVAESEESVERARLGLRRPSVRRVWPLATDLVRQRKHEPDQPERLDDLEEVIARLDWRQASMVEEVEGLAEELESLRKSLDVLATEAAGDGRRREYAQGLVQEQLAGIQLRVDTIAGRQVVPCGDTTVIRWRDWLFGLPASEWMVASGIVTGGHLENGLVEFLRATLTPGASFVEIGASFGTVFLPAAERVSPGGWAEAWEPDPLSFEYLERNTILNGHEPHPWVRVRAAAAGAADGAGELSVSRLTRTHNSFWLGDSRTAARINVPVFRLDSAYQERIDVLKIDAEGAEWDVLRGASGLLEKGLIGVIALEFTPSNLVRAGRDPGEFLVMLENLGGGLQIIDQRSGLLRPYQREAVAAEHSLNLAVLFL